jgi:cytochrome P450 family 4
MGVKLNDLGDNGVSYRQNIYVIGQLILHRLMRPWLMSDFIYSALGYRKKVDKALKPVHDFTKSIIMDRKSKFELEDEPEKVPSHEDGDNVYFRSKKRRFAMMDTLLKAQREGLIDDEGILEETDTFTFEGHDTTSAAMTFSLLLLAHSPEVQEKIFEEIQEVLNGKDELLMEDFNKMEYLDQGVDEDLPSGSVH